MAVKIKLENFEGPFDLLFHLIEKEEVNIYDIPIAKITEQYLALIEEAINIDLDIASEFLVMAATLLSIKARMLLPKLPRKLEDEPEIDPRDELVEKLLEYKKYKAASSFLQEQAGQAARALTRPDESEYFLTLFGVPELTEVSLNQITVIFAKILARIEKEPKIVKLHKREITVSDKMNFILMLINQGNKYTFEEMFEFPCSRVEVVITFLALLELIRLRKVLVKQDNIFCEIYLFQRIEEGAV